MLSLVLIPVPDRSRIAAPPRKYEDAIHGFYLALISQGHRACVHSAIIRGSGGEQKEGQLDARPGQLTFSVGQLFYGTGTFVRSAT